MVAIYVSDDKAVYRFEIYFKGLSYEIWKNYPKDKYWNKSHISHCTIYKQQKKNIFVET